MTEEFVRFCGEKALSETEPPVSTQFGKVQSVCGTVCCRCAPTVHLCTSSKCWEELFLLRPKRSGNQTDLRQRTYVLLYLNIILNQASLLMTPTWNEKLVTTWKEESDKISLKSLKLMTLNDLNWRFKEYYCIVVTFCKIVQWLSSIAKYGPQAVSLCPPM